MEVEVDAGPEVNTVQELELELDNGPEVDTEVEVDGGRR
jgi:hypothetical protein